MQEEPKGFLMIRLDQDNDKVHADEQPAYWQRGSTSIEEHLLQRLDSEFYEKYLASAIAAMKYGTLTSLRSYGSGSGQS